MLQFLQVKNFRVLFNPHSVVVEDDNVAGFAEASAVGYPRPQSASFGNYWGPFGDMVTKVLEGVSTPEEGVAEACSAFQTAIDSQ